MKKNAAYRVEMNVVDPCNYSQTLQSSCLMAASRARISSLSAGGVAEDVGATGLMGAGTAGTGAGGAMYASPVTGTTGGSSSSTS